jgi:arylsulfatase A-like enzyme
LADVGDPEIATRISQYELAFRMQTAVPELTDLSKEPKEVLELYGAKPGQASFANNCLLARRLVERGVRVVELYDADWDHHANLRTSLPKKCGDVDRGMAGLVKDLKRLGMLSDTLVVWGAEFGRTPLRQGVNAAGKATNPGRDHHKDAFCCWLAGGGVQGGVVHGKTDDFGFSPAQDPVHVHDLNATVLHLLGLDHERLTFKYQGREFRLTDVHGTVVDGLLA